MIPEWYQRTLLPGMSGQDVLAVQAIMGAYRSGVMDDATVVLVRGVQVAGHLPLTGAVDEATACLIGSTARRRAGLPPTWFGTERASARIEALVGDEAAVRRFQSAHGLPTTGVVDEQTALLLGE